MTNTEEVVLCTNAEFQAQKAEGLPNIGAFNLVSIKRTVALLLAGIGGSNIFEEYTKHDISHINEMLRLIDWIIPESSKQRMTPADWLLIVLGVYFHDLGMLVTEREYESRNQSDFESFKAKVLFSGPQSKDYRFKVNTLGAEKAERFFYQEFVRYSHAKRIRAWLSGVPAAQWGVTSVAAEVCALLEPLGEQFRDDLGIICESHHLDDLDNLKKYNISRAYGRADEEVANLQYAAIVLRTADILHMTKDRTPSVMYRVTNPTDPISQREWRKQMGVNRVIYKRGTDTDGNVSEDAPRDTVEIHAFFTEAEPFFALSSFLTYVEKQLNFCHQWAEKARGAGARTTFPWRRIDREQILAKNFISKVFAFELDQPKILNLLTGHTLYDDSGVVLRELVQNSIDAIKLQRYGDLEQGQNDSTVSGVCVEWREADRKLIVQDVGTGMTQEIIESHLLRVGSSRYSTEKFKDDHPKFFPISRFGIGILTAFMIADEVDIFTCHPDEPEARHIILRNLHGKYLIKTILKTDETISAIVPHGTRIVLTLRPSAKIADVEQILRRWIVVPSCSVTFVASGRPGVAIGHPTIEEALKESLAVVGLPVASDAQPRQGDVRVFSVRRGFADVAFACRWSETYQEWEFLGPQGQDARMLRRDAGVFGTCIEGIRVEFGSAGYRGGNLFVMANASGAGAPRTNVARSGLERTGESKELSRLIYQSLFGHLEDEVEKVSRRRKLSVTGALSEGKYLLAPLFGIPSDKDIFDDCVRDLPLMLVEQNGTRKSISPRELNAQELIWTIDSPLFTSAESLLRTSESDASLSKIIDVLSKSHFPSEPLLCRGGLDDDWALGGRGVDQIIIDRPSSRVDLRWRVGARGRYWRGLSREAIEKVVELPNLRLINEAQEFLRDRSLERFVIPVGDSIAIGAKEEICIRAAGNTYFLANNVLSKVVEKSMVAIESANDENSVLAALASLILVRAALTRRYVNYDETAVENFLERPRLDLNAIVDVRQLTVALNEICRPNRVFDPTASRRSKNPSGADFDF